MTLKSRSSLAETVWSLGHCAPQKLRERWPAGDFGPSKHGFRPRLASRQLDNGWCTAGERLVNGWWTASERLVNGFYFLGLPNEFFSGFMVVLGRGWVVLTPPMLKKMDFKYFWLKFLSHKSCVVDSWRCRLIFNSSILADSIIYKYEIFGKLDGSFHGLW